MNMSVFLDLRESPPLIN